MPTSTKRILEELKAAICSSSDIIVNAGGSLDATEKAQVDALFDTAEANAAWLLDDPASNLYISSIPGSWQPYSLSGNSIEDAPDLCQIACDALEEYCDAQEYMPIRRKIWQVNGVLPAFRTQLGIS